MLSGFSIVRNAVALDYPIVPALRSILQLCDEVVVNVGRSDDGTRERIAAIGDPRLRILDTVWDLSRGREALSLETNRAMAACRGRWGFYIQADEVLHEDGLKPLRDAVRASDGDPRVEGLLLDYVHFYGDFDTVATNRHWYRREVRVVRLGGDVRSYGDAQGFRVGAEQRRVNARATGARMFHYGWAQPRRAVREIFDDTEKGLEWTPLLRSFAGTHPRAAGAWIAEHRPKSGAVRLPYRLRLSDLRYYVSDWVERLTGARLFEYRNYVEV